MFSPRKIMTWMETNVKGMRRRRPTSALHSVRDLRHIAGLRRR